MKDVFVMGGDRWFVYVLFWIFIFSFIVRAIAKTKWSIIIVLVLFVVTIHIKLPDTLLINKVVRYSPYFFVGMYVNQYYAIIKNLLSSWLLPLSVMFAFANIGYVRFFANIAPVWIIILPFVGSMFVLSLSYRIDSLITNLGKQNGVSKFLAYCGKYSLQFYLFEMAYPVIRLVAVIIIPVTQPILIIIFVFVMQLLSAIVTVEITKRIHFFKIPMGY